jgi:hypothetical protein
MGCIIYESHELFIRQAFGNFMVELYKLSAIYEAHYLATELFKL